MCHCRGLSGMFYLWRCLILSPNIAFISQIICPPNKVLPAHKVAIHVFREIPKGWDNPRHHQDIGWGSCIWPNAVLSQGPEQMSELLPVIHYDLPFPWVICFLNWRKQSTLSCILILGILLPALSSPSGSCRLISSFTCHEYVICQR